MSEFHVPVVRLGEITKHPNADSLSIVNVFAYPCVIRTEDFQPGDLAAYVPVDAVVPEGDVRWAFLGDHRRIRAKKLRGIFSMGLLTRAEEGWVEGQDVTEALGITKYEPTIHYSRGQAEADPGFIPVYTDIEGLRRYPHILQEGEEVVVTEKLHGANGRFVWHEGRLWCGSHHQIKREDATSIWWRVAAQYRLTERLQEQAPGIILYGEVFGNVQDLKYGLDKGVDLRFFDAFDISQGRYLDWEDFHVLMQRLGLPKVPFIFRGPWNAELMCHAEGATSILGAEHCREGIVVKPAKERWNEEVGRVILKLIGEQYLLRKEA